MITTSIPIEKFSEAPIDSQIRIEPPSTEVFVATRPFTLKQDGHENRLQLGEEVRETFPSDNAEAILEKITSNGRRERDRHPGSARAYVNLGLSLLSQGKYPEAEAEFTAALERNPKFFVAGMALARIWSMQGHFEDATRLYEQLSKDHPTELLPKTGLAYVAMQRGRFDEAEQLLRTVIEGDRRNIWARYHLGLVLLKVGKWQEAINHLRDAARREVRSPAVHHALGVAYAQRGDLKKAMRSYATALSLAPQMRETVHALSEVLLKTGEGERAISILRDYVEREGTEDTETREILARACLDLGRHREARGELTKLWEVVKQRERTETRESARILNNIGLCFALEHSPDAEKYFTKALSLCPNQPIFSTNLARWYLANGEPKKSSWILENAKQHFSENHEIRLLLGLSFERVANYDAAVHELSYLIAVGGAVPEAYADLGWILSDHKKDFTLAAEILRAGYEQYPHHISVVNNYAYVLLMRGEVAKAKEVLVSFPDKGHSNVFLTATWGLLWLWEGDLNGGRVNYQLAEQMAAQAGNRSLARTVRQKMYLELAKALYRRGERQAAMTEVSRGLHVHGGLETYRGDLEELKSGLSVELKRLPN